MAKVMIGNVKGPIGPQGIQGASLKLRGTWTSGTAYVSNLTQIDVVVYGGSCYGCILSHTASTLNAPPNATYWVLLASKGDRGDEGPQPDLANNLTTTTEGFALDATQGRILNEKILPLQTAAQDSGLIELTLVNGFTRRDPGSETHTTVVRKIGKSVTVQGGIVPPANSGIGSSSTTLFAYLPDESFCPEKHAYAICTAYSTNTCEISVTPAGELRACKYQNGGTYLTPPAASWVSFLINFKAK